jgi:rRNA processing protein Gar1
MGFFVSSPSNRIGKCSIKIQGKIIVKLEGANIPKIGSRAMIKKNGDFKFIGEITEAIGSTRDPWLVISTKKREFKIVNYGEVVYVDDSHTRNKFRRKRKRKKLIKRS